MPPALDLRRCGWHLRACDTPRAEDCVALASAALLDAAGWLRFLARHGHENRRLILLVGIGAPAERARLLRLGFGEVLGSGLELGELEARALRLTELEHMLLRLDLLSREAFVGGDPLGLHPREFGLLWRLADQPGQAVSKRRLLRDVWHLRFVPETNSLAVHVSRLRAKLRGFGVEAMLQTADSGAYLLDPDAAARLAMPARLDTAV